MQCAVEYIIECALEFGVECAVYFLVTFGAQTALVNFGSVIQFRIRGIG